MARKKASKLATLAPRRSRALSPSVLEHMRAEATNRVLRRGGFDVAPRRLGKNDPVARAHAEYVALLATARSVADAAKLLGVNESRVRQRLTQKPETLYGLKVEGEWRIPRFLFDGHALLPGFDKVATAFAASDLHPVALARWFTAPDPDLVLEGISEEPVSPRDWLRLGGSPERVAKLAADL